MDFRFVIIRRMNKIELAWQAGVFDGVGSIALSDVGQLIVAIGHSQPLIIETFRLYPRWNINRTSANVLSLSWSNENCRCLLEALVPYLHLKQRQGELALEYLGEKPAYLGQRVLGQGKPRKSAEEQKMIAKYFCAIKELNSVRPLRADYWRWRDDPISREELGRQEREALRRKYSGGGESNNKKR